MVFDCLKNMNKSKSDHTANTICECMVSTMNRQFTYKQFQKYTSKGIIDLTALIKEDSLVQKRLDSCYTASGTTILLNTETKGNEFVKRCKESILKSTEKTLNPDKVNDFCTCQQNLIITKKLTDKQIETLYNPNSVLFYEMLYTCGDPYETSSKTEHIWNKDIQKDVTGPAIDTVNILSFGGMTYLKIKIGSTIQFWLFDTGATDLLINTETETILKQEGIISNSNYIGTLEYELANGSIDTCRTYRANGIQIGKSTINNVIISVTDKGKKLLVGRSLLNKFKTWALDNESSTLTLTK